VHPSQASQVATVMRPAPPLQYLAGTRSFTHLLACLLCPLPLLAHLLVSVFTLQVSGPVTLPRPGQLAGPAALGQPRLPQRSSCTLSAYVHVHLRQKCSLVLSIAGSAKE